MTEAKAFLQVIIENPDDDAPRLIFADWLEEHGDPRGEFIRVQCALENMAKDDPRRPELYNRQDQLLAQHANEWAWPVVGLWKGLECPPPEPEPARDDGVLHTLWRMGLNRWYFRRGFIDTVHMPTRLFLRYAPVLFRLAPVQSVSLSSARGMMGRLSACPYLRHLTGLILDFGGHPGNQEIGAQGIRELLSSPHLVRLRVLRLCWRGIGFRGVQAIAESPVMAQLTELGLSGNRLEDEPLEALAASPHVLRLESLDLGNNWIGAAGVRAIASSPYLAELISLSLSFNYHVGDEGCEALAASPYLRRLRRLYLSATGISDRGVHALINSPYLRGLVELWLDENDITDAGLQALIASPLAAVTYFYPNARPLSELGW